jgi:light-regulated signal transduction histidine kinase (bacteriophytochrome)
MWNPAFIWMGMVGALLLALTAIAGGLHLRGAFRRQTRPSASVAAPSAPAPESSEMQALRQSCALLERRLQLADFRLVQMQNELSSLSYSISHDLRAPLRSIEGFSQALVEDYEDSLDNTAKDYLGRVRANTQRMAALLEDLLKLSRTAQAGFKMEAINLSALAEEIAGRLSRAEPARRVEWDIQPDLFVHGDHALLQTALQQLLGNAWKFTAPKPAARIAFRALTSAQGRVEAYQVQDDGVGFDAKFARKLFGAFQRMHPPEEFPGNGIGLAIAQCIVHRHGGRIWAESAPGQGATISFTLADETDESAAMHHLHLPAISVGGITKLVLSRSLA